MISLNWRTGDAHICKLKDDTSGMGPTLIPERNGFLPGALKKKTTSKKKAKVCVN